MLIILSGNYNLPLQLRIFARELHVTAANFTIIFCLHLTGCVSNVIFL